MQDSQPIPEGFELVNSDYGILEVPIKGPPTRKETVS